jgi:hypothetical protein
VIGRATTLNDGPWRHDSGSASDQERLLRAYFARRGLFAELTGGPTALAPSILVNPGTTVNAVVDEVLDWIAANRDQRTTTRHTKGLLRRAEEYWNSPSQLDLFEFPRELVSEVDSVLTQFPFELLSPIFAPNNRADSTATVFESSRALPKQ